MSVDPSGLCCCALLRPFLMGRFPSSALGAGLDVILPSFLGWPGVLQSTKWGGVERVEGKGFTTSSGALIG